LHADQLRYSDGPQSGMLVSVNACGSVTDHQLDGGMRRAPCLACKCSPRRWLVKSMVGCDGGEHGRRMGRYVYAMNTSTAGICICTDMNDGAQSRGRTLKTVPRSVCVSSCGRVVVLVCPLRLPTSHVWRLAWVTVGSCDGRVLKRQEDARGCRVRNSSQLRSMVSDAPALRYNERNNRLW